MSLLLTYFIVGGLEWLLASTRTVACANGRSNKAACLAFTETALGLILLQYIIVNGSYAGIVAYSLGSAVGMWFGCRKREK